jgi:hypothetical protein
MAAPDLPLDASIPRITIVGAGFPGPDLESEYPSLRRGVNALAHFVRQLDVDSFYRCPV